MILIVGLGNPGPEYADTPHNMGFRVLDFFTIIYLPNSTWESKFSSQIIKAFLHGKEVVLQKPLTFMNNSGIAVTNCMKGFNITESENLWVIHDDLDLAWGRIKVDSNKSSAGHKGVESIIDTLGTTNFWRFRIGVRPDIYPATREEVDRYLTESPIPNTRKLWDDKSQQKVSELLSLSIKEGIRRVDLTL